MIEPEIGLSLANKQKIVAVYPKDTPRLNRDQAGAAIELLRTGYKNSDGHEFGILDARAGRAYWRPSNVSGTLLNSEIATIESELKRILGL